MPSNDELRALIDELVGTGRLGSALLEHLFGAPDDADLVSRVSEVSGLVRQAESRARIGGPVATESTLGASMTGAIDEDDVPTLGPGVPDLATTSRYALLTELGRGGGGEVWAAFDQILRRELAVKIIHGPGAPTEAQRRFLAEARTTAGLAHPGIIPVYDAGLLPGGRLYYSMQKLGGRSLHVVLRGLRRGEAELASAFPAPRLLRIFVQVCLAVAYAHDRGILHRDLKPGNILLGEYGEVYVADWGLASRVDAGDGRDTVSDAGTIAGTLPYMSPEQARGEADRLGPPTDVYSLGVMLFEMLTLALPFEAPTTVGLIEKILRDPAPDPRAVAPDREIPAPMAELCLSALRKSERERRLTARELAERTSAFLDGVEEHTRRVRQAAELLARSTQLRDKYLVARWELLEERRAVRDSQETLRPSAGLDARRSVWQRLQRLEEKTLEAETLYSHAVETSTRSVEQHETPDAHALLADLYWLKAEDATRANNMASAVYFRTLVRQHDQGRHRDRLAEEGELEIRVPIPETVSLKMERLVALGPLSVGDPVQASSGPQRLPVGSYIVCAEAPGRMPVRVPVLVEGNRRARVTITPPFAFEGSEQFVYVAGGSVTLGGDDAAPGALREHVAHIEPFLMGRCPINYEQYCEFLTGLAQGDPEKAATRVPRSPNGTVTWLSYDADTRRYSVPEVDRDGDRWDAQWPVGMLSWHDADAYCRWRSAVEGVTFRLPSEYEWEAAARGVDRRVFPWGNGFDPTLCRMVASVEGRPMPAPVGTYEYDCSPYGVRDMAGLIIEWTGTSDPNDPRQYVLRGGGYGSPEAWCRAATRRTGYADYNAVQFGFRVVRELPRR